MKKKKTEYDDSTCIRIAAFIGKSDKVYQTLELKNLGNFEVSVSADGVNLLASVPLTDKGKRNYKFKDFKSKSAMQKYLSSFEYYNIIYLEDDTLSKGLKSKLNSLK